MASLATVLRPWSLALGLAITGAVATAAPESPPEILQDLRSFEEMGRVLYVAAHPDDENTNLIASLSRGRSYQMAYLSLTRGDGGQNLLGPEFGDLLGVIRTQELLAARKIDGGRQYFSRARDFGFSKDYQQTLMKWDRQEVLSDVVRVIRTFRPDVVITRFSTEPSTTHGHHTASAVLALEAFKICGSATAFPDQLNSNLVPWQPKRILMNGRGFGPGGTGDGTSGAIRINIAGEDPATGENFSSIAGRSRAMHKTQGFGGYTGGGGAGPRYEYFQLLAGDPAKSDLLDGIDHTWGRIPGGEEIGSRTKEIIAAFNPKDPSASVPALLEIHRELSTLAAGPALQAIVEEKKVLLDKILQACLGLTVQTQIAHAEVVPGEVMHLTTTATLHSSVTVRWGVVMAGSDAEPVLKDLVQDQPMVHEEDKALPKASAISQPYWLREEGTPGMFKVDDPSLIGRPENPPAFPMTEIFQVGTEDIQVHDEPVQAVQDPLRGKTERRIEVIPPVSLSFLTSVQLFPRNSARSVQVEAEASRAGAEGTLEIQAPAGWTIEPARQSYRLGAPGSKKTFTFTVTSPAEPATASLAAWTTVDGIRYDTDRKEINYSHIPLLLMQPATRLKAVCLDLAIRGTKIGYLPGAGDSVAESLQQMGWTVVPLGGKDLTSDGLKGLDAVVIGVRAFNTRKDLPPAFPALLAYVAAGGTVVAQYNTPNGLLTQNLGPYPLTLSRDLPPNRVTDENAPVTLLVPDHPAFQGPNKIMASDFSGWVQERGLNFPSEWDPRYTTLLACSDVGEDPLKSGLLVAHYGKGYYVYTGLSWFRQLPAGVPGAYRLFANLVSLGK